MSYLKFWDLILPPPLPALVALGIVAFLFAAGRALARALGRPTWLYTTAAFIVMAGLIASAVHGLLWAGVGGIATLRNLGWTFSAAGWIWIASWLLRVGSWLPMLLDAIRAMSTGEKFVALLLAVTAMGLVASALGPATDADSLDYHLGTGMEWLRASALVPHDDWLHYRLAGMGERLLALGLAAGTDCLGAVVNCAAVLLLAVVLAEMAADRIGRLLGALIPLASPIMLFLVPDQKPQAMPAVGVVTAGLIAANAREDFRGADALLAFGALFAAVSCKLGLLLTGAVAGLLVLLAAYRSGTVLQSIAIAAACFALLAMPLYVHNLITYGDPVTPFLERFREYPDQKIVDFARDLREAATPPWLMDIRRLPFVLVILLLPIVLALPPSAGAVSGALGMGVMAFLPAAVARGSKGAWLLSAAAAATVLILISGQLDARYFLEPYLWAGAAVVEARANRPRRGLTGVLALQCVLTAAMAAFGAATLFPGALATRWREDVMMRSSFGYAEARWMDRVLPESGRVFTHLRSVALVPRPFVGCCRFLDTTDNSGTKALARSIANDQIQSLTLRLPVSNPGLEVIQSVCGVPLGEPLMVRDATRNPFNRGQPYTVVAYSINKDSPLCAIALADLLGSGAHAE